MRVNDLIHCDDFPCTDVRHAGYWMPEVELDVERMRIILISEAAAADPADNYYAQESPLFAQTTLLAFADAGLPARDLQELLARGVYFTTAVKCAKTGYGIQGGTVAACSRLLEAELALFPNTQVLLLMGDVAIQAVNAIARRQGLKRVIPAGSTYKLRAAEYFFQGMRVFPSYLQAGPSFFIEKSKRRTIAEDIAAALAIIGVQQPGRDG